MKDNSEKETKPTTLQASDATPCSANFIEQAWRDYHGPIDDGWGDDFIPAVPSVFIRGFVDGVDYQKAKMIKILEERQRYVKTCEDSAAESLGIYPPVIRSKASLEKRLEDILQNVKFTGGE